MYYYTQTLLQKRENICIMQLARHLQLLVILLIIHKLCFRKEKMFASVSKAFVDSFSNSGDVQPCRSREDATNQIKTLNVVVKTTVKKYLFWTKTKYTLYNVQVFQFNSKYFIETAQIIQSTKGLDNSFYTTVKCFIFVGSNFHRFQDCTYSRGFKFTVSLFICTVR